MNTEARDALPDFLHGRLGALDCATMAAHVDTCPGCRAELALMKSVNSATIVPRIDVERVVASIKPYPRIADVASVKRTKLPSYLWKVTVALALIVGAVSVSNQWKVTGSTSAPITASTSPAVSPTAVISASPPATSTQAVDIAAPSTSTAAVAAERQVASLSLVGAMQDMSDSEIETLLAELDGIEALPSAEPHTVSVSVDGMESDQ